MAGGITYTDTIKWGVRFIVHGKGVEWCTVTALSVEDRKRRQCRDFRPSRIPRQKCRKHDTGYFTLFANIRLTFSKTMSLRKMWWLYINYSPVSSVSFIFMVSNQSLYRTIYFCTKIQIKANTASHRDKFWGWVFLRKGKRVQVLLKYCWRQKEFFFMLFLVLCLFYCQSTALMFSEAGLGVLHGEFLLYSISYLSTTKDVSVENRTGLFPSTWDTLETWDRRGEMRYLKKNELHNEWGSSIKRSLNTSSTASFNTC